MMFHLHLNQFLHKVICFLTIVLLRLTLRLRAPILLLLNEIRNPTMEICYVGRSKATIRRYTTKIIDSFNKTCAWLGTFDTSIEEESQEHRGCVQ
ncbi:hypothetical protein QL285_002399 [Trifolium repens]|nr:hypothetical protein QL285_002399 [Trifolium repens]